MRKNSLLGVSAPLRPNPLCSASLRLCGRDFLAKPVQLNDRVQKIADIAQRSGWAAAQPTSSTP